jgi:hypothetical protein
MKSVTVKCLSTLALYSNRLPSLRLGMSPQALLQGSQAMPARPSDKDRVRVKTLGS